MQCLQERDELHQKLNKEFGFPNSDGRFDSGKMSYSNPEYVHRYDEIKSRSQAQYESTGTQEDGRDHEVLTVYEYLLFDNTSAEAIAELYALASQAPAKELPATAFLAARARGEVKRWQKNEYNAREMMHHEENNFSYRISHCRKFLGKRILDPRSVLALFSFKSEYMRLLETELAQDTSTFQEYQETLRSERVDNSRWILAFLVWGVGAWLLYKVGMCVERQPGGWSDIAKFFIYIAAFFYCFALWPLRGWISRLLGDRNA